MLFVFVVLNNKIEIEKNLEGSMRVSKMLDGLYVLLRGIWIEVGIDFVFLCIVIMEICIKLIIFFWFLSVC